MANKTTTVTFRMTPSIKDMLRIAADKERRSVANMIEVMVADYAKRFGIKEKQAGRTKTTNKKTK